jgi:SAM-dependent methyltransferase
MSETVSPRLAAFLASHPPVSPPWTHEYVAAHKSLVGASLDHPELMQRFADRGTLPPGYGVGFDERVVEYPWLFASSPRGRVLDAGSTLNHAHILDRLLPSLQELYITTLAPETVSFPERGISYVYADLRDLPFRDRLFDTVVSLSTLEHIGMDNAEYGVSQPRSPDVERDLALTVRELKRVLVPGGRMLVSVPYGRPEDHGWFRQFGPADVDALLAEIAPVESQLTVFRYTAEGWERSGLEGAAGAEYRDHRVEEPAQDLAAAARGVACFDLRMGR